MRLAAQGGVQRQPRTVAGGGSELATVFVVTTCGATALLQKKLGSMMASSESSSALRHAVSCQVTPSTAGEVVALWNPLVADRPEVADRPDVNEIRGESTAIATMDIEAKMPVRTVWPRRAPRYNLPTRGRLPHSHSHRHTYLDRHFCALSAVRPSPLEGFPSSYLPASPACAMP